jgi:hypothetical protein
MKNWSNIPLLKAFHAVPEPEPLVDFAVIATAKPKAAAPLTPEQGSTRSDSDLLASVLSQTAPVQTPVKPSDAPARPQLGTRSDSDLLAAVLDQTASVQAPARPRQTPARSLRWSLPGFERTCRVSTIFGELPIEALRRRDKVKTLSGAYIEVQWIDQIRLDVEFMERHPEAHPIRISARALGGPYPARNMLVSPGQDIWAPKMVGPSGPRKAIELEGQPNISKMPKSEITYYRFHCGSPQVVCVEDAWFCVSP